MTLQVYYDIAEEKRKLSQLNRPDFAKFRPTLFWDTTLDKIDCTAHSRYIINRVFERGTEEEIKEIIRFYGIETIMNTIEFDSKSPFDRTIRENLKKYIGYEA